jgi:hypothetical protein
MAVYNPVDFLREAVCRTAPGTGGDEKNRPVLVVSDNDALSARLDCS